MLDQQTCSQDGFRPRLLLVALACEFAYVAGRIAIREHIVPAVPRELAVTVWRLVFVGVYAWMASDAVRRARGHRRVGLHPLLSGAVLLDAVVTTLLPKPQSDSLLAVIVFALTTPIVALREELFYRAVLQCQLERRLGAGLAIAIATILFVVYHAGVQPLMLMTIPIAAAGVLYGVIYQRTGNLWAVVILHTVSDWLFMVPSPFPISSLTFLLGNAGVVFAALLWWSFQRQEERMGISAR